jgi:hypothetical protein
MLSRSRLVIVAGITLGLNSVGFGQEKAIRAVDITKSRAVEKPASTLLARHSGGFAVSGKDFVNPKVQPGKVNWHSSWTEACEAAKKSKKPVLLFQMMGKLDDQFC